MSAQDQMKEAVNAVLREAVSDVEDASVPFHKRTHASHPMTMRRRTARVLEIREIVNRLHDLGDEHTRDGYPQSVFTAFHRLANELEMEARKI